MIQVATELITISDAKVVDPTSNVLAGFKEGVRFDASTHTANPVAVGEFPGSLLEFPQRFRVTDQCLHTVVRNCVIYGGYWITRFSECRPLSYTQRA